MLLLCLSFVALYCVSNI